jgi:hypothetical protein
VIGAREGRVEGSLPAGLVAYVDADWLPAVGSAPLPAIMVDDDADADRAAGGALLSLADSVLAAIAGIDPDSIDIVGRGILAAHIRATLGPSNAGGERPEAVVDFTGDAETIAAATRRLADLGLLVLAGEQLGRPVSLDLYPDVHVRGLRLLGVPPPGAASGALEGDLPELFRETLRAVEFGSVPPPDGAWFRIGA